MPPKSEIRQHVIDQTKSIVVKVGTRVLTDHDAIGYEAIASAVPAVFDARGAYGRRGIEADNVIVL